MFFTCKIFHIVHTLLTRLLKVSADMTYPMTGQQGVKQKGIDLIKLMLTDNFILIFHCVRLTCTTENNAGYLILSPVYSIIIVSLMYSEINSYNHIFMSPNKLTLIKVFT